MNVQSKDGLTLEAEMLALGRAAREAAGHLLEATAAAVADVAALSDPVGRELARWKRPNGLDIARVATPIGVLGIIYESRPNVTADAGALCLKSGNAVILRGGSDSLASSRAIHAALVEGLDAAGLPAAA